MGLITSFKFCRLVALIVAGVFARSPKAEARIALIVGGGGEATVNEAGEVISAQENLFREHFVQLGRSFEGRTGASAWEARYFFGGNETTCVPASGGSACPPSGDVPSDSYSRATLANDMGVQPARIRMATRQNFLDSLDELLARPVSGGQILFVFPTHGSRQYPPDGAGVFSTRLALGNDEWISTDDPELITRLQQLRERRAQMGFVQGSCHGGYALRDWTEFGCVITASPVDLTARNSASVADGALASCMGSGSVCGTIFWDRRTSLDEVYIRTIVQSAIENPADVPLMSGDGVSRSYYQGFFDRSPRHSLGEQRFDDMQEDVSGSYLPSLVQDLLHPSAGADSLFAALENRRRSEHLIVTDCWTISDFTVASETLVANLNQIWDVVEPRHRSDLYNRLFAAAGPYPLPFTREEFVNIDGTLAAINREIVRLRTELHSLYRREIERMREGNTGALTSVRESIRERLTAFRDQVNRMLSLSSLNRAASYIHTRDSGNLTPEQQACADFEL